MKHVQWQDVSVINRTFDYNSKRIVFAIVIFIALQSAASAAQRYTVRRPVTPPPSVVEQDPLSEESPRDPQCGIHWETNYESALKSAKESRRSLLVYFESAQASPDANAACGRFNDTALKDFRIASELDKYVLVKVQNVSETALVPAESEATPLEESVLPTEAVPDFSELESNPGLVLVEFEDTEAAYYGQTVAVLPFLNGESPTPEETLTFLTLPPGTLTQRTMIYAVRIHPHQPLGATGFPNPVTSAVATEQAEYQAERGILGHQNYGQRSSQALDALGGGSPSEICAQSRPGIGLFEGALSCMHAWRNSSAHWNFLRREHRCFGFDIRRSKNGTWFSTGFFVD
ncbi:hypothetical protein FACS1894170_08440 [Planctomycetales bacterium]|nr:hypothetical protein FACS1894170_08440 [Planctomycetales bacterium]